MKPLHGLFERMTDLDALFAAAHATLSHGRRFRGEGARFKFDLECEVLRLHKALTAGRYRHGRYRLFTVRDPKMRIIAAAPVRDRVVHHAVHDAIEPRLDRMFIHDSYACRAGKGTHRAIDRAHGFLRANRYGLHLDVKQYFRSINHDLLKALLRRYVADERALDLLLAIIDSTAYLAHSSEAGRSVTEPVPGPQGMLALEGLEPAAADRDTTGKVRGIPLGNLTSQFFANLYLNELDQYIKHTLKVRYYARYMDDMLLFADDKVRLLEWEHAVRAFARDRLRLELHPSGGPRPVTRGIGFLGFRLFPEHRRLNRKSVTRFIRRMNAYVSEHETLRDDEQQYAQYAHGINQSVQSFHAHALHGNTYALRQRLYSRYPVISQFRLAGLTRTLCDGDAADCRENGRSECVAAAAGGQVPA